MTTDFRQVYATILGEWLAIRGDVLGARYEPVKLFA
jgi:hypothetical protein